MANKIKSKNIATDSNYLRCHALLTVLHFPLENTCSCKEDRKERYSAQQFWRMERDISVRPTEMTRPVTVDHLQSWSRIFRSDQTETVRSIWWTHRNFRTFVLNGRRPRSGTEKRCSHNHVWGHILYRLQLLNLYLHFFCLVPCWLVALFSVTLLHCFPVSLLLCLPCYVVTLLPC